jgi:hypothetical protein
MSNLFKKGIALGILVAIVGIIFLFYYRQDTGHYVPMGDSAVLDTKTGTLYLISYSKHRVTPIDVLEEAKK